MLDPDAARALIDGFREGWHHPSDLIARPLIVVGVAGDDDWAGVEVPAAFPAVVVVVGASEAPAIEPGGADVALTSIPGAPAPWVRAPDAAQAMTALIDRITNAPTAAVTLVQVLRAGRGMTVEEGLVLESLAYSMLQSGPEFSRWRAGRAPAPTRPAGEPPVMVRPAEDRIDIVLNRPEVHNAYNRAMRDQLCEALAVAVADRGRRVVLSGAGPSFCSGGDLDEFGTAPDPPAAHLVRTAQSPARLIHGLSARVEAHLHGVCAGSGIELPAFAGTVRARPGTRIWLPELAMGLIPGAGGTVSVARRIGSGRTAWLGLSGQAIDERTALGWGLVDEVSGQGD